MFSISNPASLTVSLVSSPTPLNIFDANNPNLSLFTCELKSNPSFNDSTAHPAEFDADNERLVCSHANKSLT